MSEGETEQKGTTEVPQSSSTVDACAELQCSSQCIDLCYDFGCCENTTTSLGPTTTTTAICDESENCDCDLEPCDMSENCLTCCGDANGPLQQIPGCMNASDCEYDPSATCDTPSMCCDNPETGETQWSGSQIQGCCKKSDGTCGGVTGCCSPDYCDRNAWNPDAEGGSAADNQDGIDCCSDIYCNENDRYRCVDMGACNYAMSHSLAWFPQYPNWWCVRAAAPICEYDSCATTQGPPTTLGPTTTGEPTSTGEPTTTTFIKYTMICGDTPEESYCMPRINAGQYSDVSMCEGEMEHNLGGNGCVYTTPDPNATPAPTTSAEPTSSTTQTPTTIITTTTECKKHYYWSCEHSNLGGNTESGIGTCLWAGECQGDLTYTQCEEHEAADVCANGTTTTVECTNSNDRYAKDCASGTCTRVCPGEPGYEEAGYLDLMLCQGGLDYDCPSTSQGPTTLGPTTEAPTTEEPTTQEPTTSTEWPCVLYYCNPDDLCIELDSNDPCLTNDCCLVN